MDEPEGIPIVEGNLHGWSTKEEIPSLMGAMRPRVDIPTPVKDLRRRASEWRWGHTRRRSGGRWKTIYADQVHVHSDLPIDVMRELAVYVEDFNGMLGEALGDPGHGHGPMPKYVLRAFANRTDFCRFAACLRAVNAESLYSPLTKEMAICFDSSMSKPWIQRIIAHEFTHAYMDKMWGSTSPLWFAEGMAEFFSNFIWADNQLWPGGLNSRAILLATIGGPVDLETLFNMGRSEMYGNEFPMLYAQSWTFVHYLFARRPDAIKGLLIGNEPPMNLTVDGEWHEHIQEMVAAIQ